VEHHQYGLTHRGILALAIDPNASTFYAAGMTGSPNGPTGGVFKSVDGGASWTATSVNTIVQTLAVDPQVPTTFYAGYAGGVIKSTDGGDTGLS